MDHLLAVGAGFRVCHEPKSVGDCFCFRTLRNVCQKRGRFKAFDFQTFNKTLKIKTWKTGNPFGIKAEEGDVSFYRNCGAASVGYHNI